MKKIRVGSRDSKLAVLQTNIIIEEIKRLNPDVEVELITMKTTGDIILDKTLDKIGGKGLFVKELDRALHSGTVDITVHSLKDMPAEIDESLPILGFYKRGNPMDCLVLPKGKKIEELKDDCVIGSSSNRRNIQLRALFKNYVQRDIRGNVITRLEKLDKGDYDALVLAAAGLERLGLENRITKEFSVLEMIPAAGQGILVVQGREGEDYSLLDNLWDEKTTLEAEAEREFIKQLDGGCSAPIGSFAQVFDNKIKVNGIYAKKDSMSFVRDEIVGEVSERKQIITELITRLKEKYKEK